MSSYYRDYANESFEPDDDHTEQPRCERCGAFLPFNPNAKSKIKVGQQDDQTYNDEGEPETFTIISESWQPILLRQCKRCGHCQDEMDGGQEETVRFNPPLVGDWRPVEGKPGESQVIWRV